MQSAIYVGQIAHRRNIPKPHGFCYPFFMWFVNLDRMERLPDLGRWFSVRRWAMSRLCRSDYLGDAKVALADAVRERLLQLTDKPVTGEVCGLMNVRTFGLYFSPVNFYYGFSKEQGLTHFLAEVSNTPWNERHHYAAYVGEGEYEWLQTKAFKVSPFNPVEQQYRWRIEPPGEKIAVSIEVVDRRGEIFAASLSLERHRLDLATVRRMLLKKPIMTASIISAIYSQALRIYLKGIPYVPYIKEAI